MTKYYLTIKSVPEGGELSEFSPDNEIIIWLNGNPIFRRNGSVAENYDITPFCLKENYLEYVPNYGYEHLEFVVNEILHDKIEDRYLSKRIDIIDKKSEEGMLRFDFNIKTATAWEGIKASEFSKDDRDLILDYFKYLYVVIKGGEDIVKVTIQPFLSYYEDSFVHFLRDRVKAEIYLPPELSNVEIVFGKNMCLAYKKISDKDLARRIQEIQNDKMSSLCPFTPHIISSVGDIQSGFSPRSLIKVSGNIRCFP